MTRPVYAVLTFRLRGDVDDIAVDDRIEEMFDALKTLALSLCPAPLEVDAEQS